MRTITIVNQQTTVSAEAVAAGVAAVQAQLTEHYCPAWGLQPVTLVLSAKDVAGERIYLLDNTTQADALGYHEDGSGNVPVGYVFVKTTIEAGDNWVATLSHEAMEQVLDAPCCDTMLAVFLGMTAAVAKESADPVENDEYPIDGQVVSNFVLPTWFVAGSPGPWDYLGRLSAPLTLSPGGYVAYSTNLRTWRETFGRSAPAHQRKPGRFSRRTRRYRRSAA